MTTAVSSADESDTGLPDSPYRGLRPFGDSELDALFFFGRAREAEIVAANLMASRLTVLYGASGVGKSSLLRAGVARRLRADGAIAVVFSAWRDDPVNALQEAVTAELGDSPGDLPLADNLAVAGREIYLVLDQVDEYFLYHGRERGEGTFAEELANIVDRPGLSVNVLLGIREDALAKLDALKARIPRLFSNFLRLDHLDRDAGRQAVLGPLKAYERLGGGHYEIEPELVEAVLDQVGAGRIDYGRAGRGEISDAARAGRVEAPYLQLVLERLWEVEREQGSRTLRLATLEALGGAQRIVRDHLERALRTLRPDEKRIASALFNYLVTPSGTKIAHAASDLARYAEVEPAVLEPVVSRLTAERILRPAEEAGGGDGRYEIFHDVLGDAVLAWRGRFEAERVLERERQAARRRQRRLARLAGGALGALALLAVLTVYAFLQRGEARDQRAQARLQALAARDQARQARARELDAMAIAELDRDPQRGLRLAVQAARLSPTAQAEDVLRRALLASRQRGIDRIGTPVRMVAPLVGKRLVSVTDAGDVYLAGAGAEPARAMGGDIALPSPDAWRLLVIGSSRPAALIDDDGQEIWSLPARWIDATFSLDGSTIAAVDVRGRVQVRRAATGARVTVITAPERVRRVVAGFRAVAAVGARKVYLYDPAGPRLVGTFDQGARVEAIAVSPDGHYLATGGSDGRVRVVDMLRGKSAFLFRGHVGQVTSLAFSPRARLLASASTDGTGRVWWLVPSGGLTSVLEGHGNYVTDVVFGPDGYTIATASLDGTARIWKAQNGARLALLAGHSGPVRTVAFTAAGDRVVTAGADGTVRLWDVLTQPLLRPLLRIAPSVEAARFTSDGARIVAWDARGVERTLAADGKVISKTRRRAPDKRSARYGRLTASADGNDVVVRTPGGERHLDGHTDRLTSVAFSPDGSRLVTASRDHSVRVWDVAGGRAVRTLRVHFAVVSDARFSADGRWIVTAGPGKAALIDARTGRFMFYLQGHRQPLTSASFDPQSRRIVTSSRDGTVRLYVCEICGGTASLLALAERRLAGAR